MVQAKKNKVPKAAAKAVEQKAPVVGGWAATLQELSPEEQQAEAERQRLRNEKAQQAALQQQKQNEKNEWYEKERQKNERKKNQEDRKWEAQLSKNVEKGIQEGILVAAEGADGGWYVEVAPKTWRECTGQYFCSLCEKHLNDSTLTAHLESEGHRKKRDWMLPANSSSAAAAPAPPVKSKQPKPTASQTQWCGPCNETTKLEDWQELGADGYVRCIPCGKMCDGSHEYSTSHNDKLEWWRYRQETEKNGYEAPELEYLAYVPFDEVAEPNGPRGLRCLMCKKWVNDDYSHSGTHAKPDGSKEHQKNLRNYGPGNQWWEDEVVKVRQKWHPQQPKQRQAQAEQVAKKQPTLAPWATAEHKAASSNTTSRQPPETELAPGWTAHKDETTGDTFYFNEASGESTWEMPVAEAQGVAPRKLPAGWQRLKDESTGDTYYHNDATNETTWEFPSIWKEAKDSEGSVYYYNSETNETQWDKPADF